MPAHLPPVQILKQLFAKAAGKAAEGQNAWDSATHMGDPGETPGSWLQTNPTLAVVSPWGMNQNIKNLSLPLSLPKEKKGERKRGRKGGRKGEKEEIISGTLLPIQLPGVNSLEPHPGSRSLNIWGILHFFPMHI